MLIVLLHKNICHRSLLDINLYSAARSAFDQRAREAGFSYGRLVLGTGGGVHWREAGSVCFKRRADVKPTSRRRVCAIIFYVSVERLTLLVNMFIEILFFYTMNFIFFLGCC